ncbi:MAG: outer membrane lipoprotein-sorting protein [Bacteroidota bacterium]
MKRINYLKGGVFLLMICLSTHIHAQDALSIIKKAEEVRRGIESSQAEMTMTIVRPTWTREMKMKSWSKGDDYALILVTAPVRDKGTTNLKRQKEIWTWLPRVERTVKLPPSMMSQSWMGSDFTNEDLVRENSIITDYSHTMLQDSVIAGRNCYKLQLVPKEDASVIWGKIHLWIDKKDYLQLRTEFFDEDMYLINVMQASEIKQMGGRTFATKLEMIPVEEEGQKTVMVYENIIFDKKLPDSFFSQQNMKRVR